MDDTALVLRPIDMDDANVLIAWRNDEVTRGYARQTHEISIEEHLAWLEPRTQGFSGEIHRIAQIERGNIPVGYTYVTFDPTDRTKPAEVHYRVAPEWRGRGIASIMVPLFLRTVVFKDVGAQFLCPIIKGNIPSERLATKLGLHPGLERNVSESDSRIIVDWVQD